MRFDRGRTVRRDDIATREIDQMRQHRTARGAAQRRVEPDVKTFDHKIYRLDARFEAIDDPRFALAAMSPEFASATGAYWLPLRRPISICRHGAPRWT